MSQRKEIRHAIGNVLRGNTSVGDHVYVSRTRKLPKTAMPGILVYTLEESAEIFNAAPRLLERVLSVGIQIVARADEDLDDVLDGIAWEVERIMSENQTLGGLVSDIVLSRTDIALTDEGDNQHGGAILSYDVTYYTEDVSYGVEGPGVPPENVLRPFERAGSEWRPNDATAESVKTQDLTNLPQ